MTYHDPLDPWLNMGHEQTSVLHVPDPPPQRRYLRASVIAGVVLAAALLLTAGGLFGLMMARSSAPVALASASVSPSPSETIRYVPQPGTTRYVPQPGTTTYVPEPAPTGYAIGDLCAIGAGGVRMRRGPGSDNQSVTLIPEGYCDLADGGMPLVTGDGGKGALVAWRLILWHGLNGWVVNDFVR